MGRAVHDAGALEPREFGQRRLAIAGAAGDDDRSRPHDLAAGELHLVGRRSAVETDRASRDRHLRAELLALHQRASRQVLAGDAGGKPEVVLDA